jgi:hypothetical protein
MWESLAPLSIIPALLILFAAVLRRSCSRVKENVVRWTRENGFELSGCEWRCRGGQLLLRLRVVDRDGRIRDGWVRCGASLVGALSRRVHVRWAGKGCFPHNARLRSGS